MLSTSAAFTTVLPQSAQRVFKAPEPTPTPTTVAPGFDWSRVRPDPSAVPNDGDIFYTITNAVMFLGIVAAVTGLVAGAIAFGVGPIFGAHMISDRGKSMMWKAGLVAIIVGSATTLITFLLTQQ